MSAKLSPTQIASIEARMKALPDPDLTDQDNPEWTAEDFQRAVGPEGLSDVELAAFPRTAARGRPPVETPKAHVSIRLAPDVLDFYRSKGKGWQGEVEAVLRKAMKG